ncbi:MULTISPECIES: hypothetical protein [Butyricimonas]|uniref:hypothetical protein n=1 Tax=Butyricimonas TaxID=574697 RepID=UPI0007FB2405|nr:MULTISPECIES: hypothetical protein [Butyricimonas]
MKYLVIDALLDSTGIRDKYNGGYINPYEIGLSFITITRLNEWLSKYWNEHFNGYVNENLIDRLDEEGREIAIAIKKELPEVKVEYFSDARMVNVII